MRRLFSFCVRRNYLRDPFVIAHHIFTPNFQILVALLLKRKLGLCFGLWSALIMDRATLNRLAKLGALISESRRARGIGSIHWGRFSDLKVHFLDFDANSWHVYHLAVGVAQARVISLRQMDNNFGVGFLQVLRQNARPLTVDV